MREALSNVDDFSSTRAVQHPTKGIGSSTSILIGDDPPLHTRLRALAQRWFTSKSLEHLRPYIKATNKMLLDCIESDPVDVVCTLSEPLPVMTVATLLGLDPCQWRNLKRWSGAIFAYNDSRPDMEKLRDSLAAHQYIASLIRQRRTAPLNDLISHLVESNHGDEALGDADLLAYCVLLLVAGNETTVNLLGNVLNILSTEPDIWSGLCAGKYDSSAIVEETLRFDGPAQILRRTTKRDVLLNGFNIPKGVVIEACVGAANRDPQVFMDPDRFDPTRTLKRHLGLGQGIHFCLGASLARMVVENTVEEVADRFSQLTRVSEGVRLTPYAMSGFKSLHVQFSRRVT